MKGMHMAEFCLVVIGGLNWGLVGLGGFMTANANDWNVIHTVLGAWPQVEWIVYILVGLSALHLMFTHKKDCRMCNPSGMAGQM
jgi:uncharacterized membrane protein YuzA (DUF378 family)